MSKYKDEVRIVLDRNLIRKTRMAAVIEEVRPSEIVAQALELYFSKNPVEER